MRSMLEALGLYMNPKSLQITGEDQDYCITVNWHPSSSIEGPVKALTLFQRVSKPTGKRVSYISRAAIILSYLEF